METLTKINKLPVFTFKTIFAEPGYFIYARTVDGAIFLSEDFDDYLLEEYLDTYKSLVLYFNGGEIILYKIDENDYYPVEEFQL